MVSASQPSTSPSAPASTSASPSLPSSAFSFKAPFPAASSSSTPATPIKQRRVSLALPSNSPRLVQAWSFRDDTRIDAAAEKRTGKMRKIEPTANEFDKDFGGSLGGQESLLKKPRKKWTQEETQMLVDGCNRHGVGNWKTILSDPTLSFDNRSPVDLKDRFRTYFPDAYKQHYPNARTHLSSKVRSTLPDGTPLFEKTRSKRRRPFTPEEDKALKAGYEKHGTVWAAIVKDPVFAEQQRRSTDLRDRFRNAFPELYQAAGYKPRAGAGGSGSAGVGVKKVAEGGSSTTPSTPSASASAMLSSTRRRRAATDDHQLGAAGPVRSSRRRAKTSQGLLRGGTKSVPQSTVVSEDEDSDDEQQQQQQVQQRNDEEGSSPFKLPAVPLRSRTPVLVDNVSTSSDKPILHPPPLSASASYSSTTSSSTSSSGGETFPFLPDDDDEMELLTIDMDEDPFNDFLGSSSSRSHHHQHHHHQQQQQHDMDALPHWSSGIDTPTHWAGGSPASSHLESLSLSGAGEDYLMNAGGGNESSVHSSPFHNRYNNTTTEGSNNMIGKSAWGATSWFSSNPRLGTAAGDASSSEPTSTASTSTSSFIDGDSSQHHLLLSSPPPPSCSSPLLSPFHQFGLFGMSAGFGGGGGGGHDALDRYGHGVMDRYDLFPPSHGHHAGVHHHHGALGDFFTSASEAGVGETHSTFSDDDNSAAGAGGGGGVGTGAGYRGFTHHSNYAGDLIFGARGGGGGGWGYGFGAGGLGNANTSASAPTIGLGLTGMNTVVGQAGGGGGGSQGIHPMQLHARTTTGGMGPLPGIDEIELTGITLEDDPAPPAGAASAAGGDDEEMVMADVHMEGLVLSPSAGVKDEHGLEQEMGVNNNNGNKSSSASASLSLSQGVGVSNVNKIEDDLKPFNLDDLVDLDSHVTPPGTPLISSAQQARPPPHSAHSHSQRRQRPVGTRRSSSGHMQQYTSPGSHARSISVPPSEARSSYAPPGGMHRPGLDPQQQQQQQQHHANSQPDLWRGPFFSSPSSTSQEKLLPPPPPPKPTHHVHVHHHHHHHQQQQQPFLIPPATSASFTDTTLFNQGLGLGTQSDIYDLPFLDLHYYGHAVPEGMGMGFFGEGGDGARGGLALDLAMASTHVVGGGSGNAPGSSMAPGNVSKATTPTGNSNIWRHHQEAFQQQQQQPSMVVGGGSRNGTVKARAVHQRGMSAVCPEDLMLRSGDNKRKRASWDGGLV